MADPAYDWEKDVKPYAAPGSTFIQWKGTQVCMDLVCLCGGSVHIDGEFLYAVKCPHCQRVLQLGSAVAVREAPADYTGVVFGSEGAWEFTATTSSEGEHRG